MPINSTLEVSHVHASIYRYMPAANTIANSSPINPPPINPLHHPNQSPFLPPPPRSLSSPIFPLDHSSLINPLPPPQSLFPNHSSPNLLPPPQSLFTNHSSPPPPRITLPQSFLSAPLPPDHSSPIILLPTPPTVTLSQSFLSPPPRSLFPNHSSPPPRPITLPQS